MRDVFFRTLAELAERDPRILLLTGDLGYLAIEPFVERCPRQFFNMGVAEQNMVGVATGLAEAGFIPFVYSIVTFAVLRPYEFIRNGPVLHQLPVRIVGVGGGMEYGQNGVSHHGLDDIGVLRVQPGLSLIAPADPVQTETALHQVWDLPGPLYIRLGKDNKTITPGLDGRFVLGELPVIGENQGDVLFVALGAAANQAVAARTALQARGVRCSVAVVDQFLREPPRNLVPLLRSFGHVVTVEAHYEHGGVGSLVSEVIADSGLSCRLTRCAVRQMAHGVSGSQQWLHELHGLSAEALVRAAA